MKHNDLIDDGASETEIRTFLAECGQVAVAFRIPPNLRNGAKEAAEFYGMSFSPFMRACMLNEMAKGYF